MDLSCTVSEINGNFSGKSLNFPTRVYFAPLLKGFPLELGAGARGQKVEWWACRAEKEVWRYLQPSGYNAPTWQTSRWTDRRTPGDSKDRAYVVKADTVITTASCCVCAADDLTGVDWWNWWGDDDDDDAGAAAALPDTPSTSSSWGCGSDGVPDSPLTLGPSSFHAAAAAGPANDAPWPTTVADKLFPALETPPFNRLQSSYVPRDLLLCMTSRTSVDAESMSFVRWTANAALESSARWKSALFSSWIIFHFQFF